MQLDLQGIRSLQQLRIDLQEEAGIDFPQSHLKELLVLYDVCKYLDLTYFQAQEVLGTPGLSFVTNYINQPINVEPRRVDQA